MKEKRPRGGEPLGYLVHALLFKFQSQHLLLGVSPVKTKDKKHFTPAELDLYIRTERSELVFLFIFLSINLIDRLKLDTRTKVKV